MKKIIKLLRRAPKKNQPRSRVPIYDICVVKSGRGKFVFEKIGSYSQKASLLKINAFRLVFWLSLNVSLSGSVCRLFLKTNIFR